MDKTIQQYSPVNKQVSLEQIVKNNFEYSLTVFDERTIEFFNALSVSLLNNKSFNRNPEIVSLGFWLRKANTQRFREENQQLLRNKQYTANPLGLVFHVAPSNVDTIFLYSLCISLLMGNRNVVRLSSRSTATVDFIIACINETVNKSDYLLFADYLTIITYGHDDEINKYLSLHSNCRVIWGGDKTVNHFKNIPSSVYCKDVLFPNRVSYSVFKVKPYFELTEEQQKEVVKNFYNDAYVFDQMGCSSPKLIYILGSEEEKEKFVELFYRQLSDLTGAKYREQGSSLSTLKLNTLVSDALSKEIEEVKHVNNCIYFVEIPLQQAFGDSCGGGYFYLKHIKKITDIQSDLFQAVQTLGYYGISEDEIEHLNKRLLGKRVDRIVPIGQALTFHYIWDGMNLFEELSRKRFIS